jgi:hypothetical protein
LSLLPPSLDDEVTQDLFRDPKGALELADPARVEADLMEDVVAVEVASNRVGEPSTAPVVDVNNLAAVARNRLLKALEARRDGVLGNIGTKDDYEFVVA